MRTLFLAKSTFVLVALLAGAALLLNWVTCSRVHGSIEELQRSMDIKTEWENLISSMTEAETGERGYLLTGDEKYLKPFEDAKLAISDSTARLRMLDPLNGKHIRDLDEIRSLTGQRLDLAVEKITVRRREGLEAAIQLVKTNRGKQMSEIIRDRISREISDQRQDIKGWTGNMQHDLKWGYYSAISTSIITVLGGCLVIFHLYEFAFHKLREDRLRKGKLRAEVSERHKSSFLSNMSHEIRTPMNAILGFSELLEAEATTDKQKRYTQSILVGGRALLHLINDILDLSKIEAGMMPVKLEATEVRDVGRLLEQLFAHQVVKKNLSFRIEVPESMPHSLLIDSGKLRQILINVVGNSLKFTKHGHVLVRFASEPSPLGNGYLDLRIEVEDSGEGIAAGQMENVFTPFFQVGESPAGEQRGSGLGLSIVSQLVELMGGTVMLSSEVGLGTTFRFHFPGVKVSARLPQTLTASDRVVDFNNLQSSKLLVVDDNPTNCELVKSIFENSHHQVLVANDGVSAVKAVLEEKPDIVLMDIRMPGMSGREALQAIRSHPQFGMLPVLAVTASCLDDEESELRLKFDGYLNKPFTRAELYREISLFLPKHDPNQAEVAGELAVISPELSLRWQNLAVELRKMERDVWPSARDGMVMSEVNRFAAKLLVMADDAQCPPLVGYATQLCADAAAFSIASLEQGLSEFPLRISEIEQYITSAKS